MNARKKTIAAKRNPANQEPVTLTQVEDKILTIRGQSVLLDSDVAALYAVATKEVNQAVQRNPEKFPEGYIIQLDNDEWKSSRSKILILKEKELVKNYDEKPLRSQIVTLEKPGQGQHSKYAPRALTEKGLYMLATILKGARAVQTTIAIVETYSKIRELARTVAQLAEPAEKTKQQSLMQKSGEIMADILGESMKTTNTETSVEINLAILKFKHTTIKRKPE